MDTRKAQRTGKSTFIVSLPKAWSTKRDIAACAKIYINHGANGALTLSTDRSEQDLRARLDIGDKIGSASGKGYSGMLGSEEEQLMVFRQVRDEIKKWIAQTFVDSNETRTPYKSHVS